MKVDLNNAKPILLGSAADPKIPVTTAKNIITSSGKSLQDQMDSGEISGTKVIKGHIIPASLWAYDDTLGCFKADIKIPEITEDKVANVNFSISSLEFAEYVGVYGCTDSYNGGVYIYSTEKPDRDYIADIVII